MELKNLQAQINPHLLYNTLQTIFWKTVGLTGSSNEASKMIEYLSDILYYVLSIPGHIVFLKQELKYTDSYLNIQKIRYSGKFEVIWNYDEALISCKVVKLLFQPILENSILHGIEPGEKEKYLIKISIWEKDNNLHVRITDNAVGIDRDNLEKLREKIKNDDHAAKHIGLSNVAKRLLLLYGKQAGFTIQSKKGHGTSIHLYFPYIAE